MTISSLDINSFIESIPDNFLSELFHHYYRHGYDHLLLYPVMQLSNDQMKLALKRYLERFILENNNVDGKIDERRATLAPIVMRKDYKSLYDVIYYDQYFEEPLMHIANQNEKNYSLDHVSH